MSSQTFKVEGLSELNAALEQLSKSTGRAVLRRVGMRALQPVAEAARSNAMIGKTRRWKVRLRDTITVASKLTKAQAKKNRKLVREGGADSSAVEVYAGSRSSRAPLLEFGTIKTPPHPFMRPAWDANKARVLELVKDGLKTEISATAARVAKRAARAAAKGD